MMDINDIDNNDLPSREENESVLKYLKNNKVVELLNYGGPLLVIKEVIQLSWMSDTLPGPNWTKLDQGVKLTPPPTWSFSITNLGFSQAHQ
jgi:hypothetical protein